MMTEATERTDLSIPMAKAQTASLPFGLFAVAEALVFFLIWGGAPIKAAADLLLPWFFFPVFAAGVVVHELLHGFAWMLGGKLPFSNMKFGFQVKTFTPYAHCTVPIPKSAYVFGTLMPLLVLGVMPFLLSLVNGNGWLLLFGVLFTFAAAGDMLIVWLIRSAPMDAMVADHPENAGCYIFPAPER